MDIGRPKRIIEIDPISLPLPTPEMPSPVPEMPSPVPEPLHEPAPQPRSPAEPDP